MVYDFIVPALVAVIATKWILTYHRANGLAWTAWCAIVGVSMYALPIDVPTARPVKAPRIFVI